MQHVLFCPKGELLILDIKGENITAGILGKVCKNVVIEPLLTPLTGEEFLKSSNTGNQARADVSARRLWIDGQMTFRDVRILNH